MRLSCTERRISTLRPSASPTADHDQVSEQSPEHTVTTLLL